MFYRPPAYHLHTPPLRHFPQQHFCFVWANFCRLLRALYHNSCCMELPHIAVLRQAFQGVTLSFHLSEYQFSKNRIQIFYFHTTLCVTFSVTNVSHSFRLLRSVQEACSHQAGFLQWRSSDEALAQSQDSCPGTASGFRHTHEV
jgi:hypothetical protein